MVGGIDVYSLINNLSNVFIAVGFIVFLLGFLGCVGACCENKVMLVLVSLTFIEKTFKYLFLVEVQRRYESTNMTYRSSLSFDPDQWFFYENMDLENFYKITVFPSFFYTLADIELIFGMKIYHHDLQFKFDFYSGSMIFMKLWAMYFKENFFKTSFLTLFLKYVADQVKVLLWFIDIFYEF